MPTLFKINDWACRLECDQCDHIRPNGVRCRNRACLGTPTCWTHTISKYGVRAKASTIPGAGKGLFATRAFKAGDWICPYIGEPITQECLDNRYPGDMTAPYAEQIPGGFVDSACVRGIGSISNALFTNNGRCRSASQHNSVMRYRPSLRQVWLKATRGVQSGAEIFNWYGNTYRLEDGHVTKTGRGQDTRPC